MIDFEDPTPTTPRTALAEATARLTAAIHEYDRSVAAWSDDLTWEDAALILRHAREQVTLLGAAVGAVEARVIVARREADLWGDIPVEGVGVVAVHRPQNRKQWDHDALIGQVIDRRMDDHPDGEVPPPWEVAKWIQDAAGFSYWRVGALADLGLDADDYCASAPGRPTVQIISSAAPPAPL